MLFAPPPLPVEVQQRAYQVAYVNRIAEPKCSPITVTWMPGDALLAKYPQYGIFDALATPGSHCTIEISEDLFPVRACSVLVHELGHLAGFPHSDDPNSVMYKSGHTVEGCVEDAILNPTQQPTVASAIAASKEYDYFGGRTLSPECRMATETTMYCPRLTGRFFMQGRVWGFRVFNKRAHAKLKDGTDLVSTG